MRRVQSVPLPAGLPGLVPNEMDDNANLTSVFEMDLDPKPLARSSLEHVQVPDDAHPELAPYNLDSLAALSDDNVCLMTLLRLCRSTSQIEVEIAHLVKSQAHRSPGHSETCGDAVALAAKLTGVGYHVNVVQSCPQCKDTKKCFKNLRHTFLVCVGYKDVWLHHPIIVDVKFRDQFLIANPTCKYDLLVKALPEVYVGTLSKLKAIVSLVSEECLKAFHDQELPLPPWRTKNATLSKWSSAEVQLSGSDSGAGKENAFVPVTNILVSAGPRHPAFVGRSRSPAVICEHTTSSDCATTRLHIDCSSGKIAVPPAFSPRNKVRSLLAIALCKSNAEDDASKSKQFRAEPRVKITTVRWGALRGQNSKASHAPRRQDVNLAL